VTHPFHPLSGCEFELVDYRKSWGKHRVYFYDSSEQLRQVPASWTDVVGEDPYIAIAQGRSALHFESLLRLADLLDGLCHEIGQCK